MVSGQTIGTVGVAIGTVLVIVDFTSAGMGVMLLGIVGAILAEVSRSGQEGRRR